MDVQNYPRVIYRNERRAAMIQHHKSSNLWKKEANLLPVDVWKKICDEAMKRFTDEWDAKGRALGLLD
jgi:hypothetical protein